MPQARSSGSGSSSGGSSSGRSSSRRSSASGASSSRSSGTTRRTTKSSSSSGTSSRSRARSSSSGAGRASSSRASRTSTGGAAQTTSAADPRLDAVAQRVRKLNEKIIEESKSAGEATLTAYEKALKAIAGSLERGPGRSDVEWISTLATTQAKWIRDVTAAWTSAARGMLK
jgi:hypothetical protein